MTKILLIEKRKPCTCNHEDCIEVQKTVDLLADYVNSLKLEPKLGITAALYLLADTIRNTTTTKEAYLNRGQTVLDCFLVILTRDFNRDYGDELQERIETILRALKAEKGNQP